MKQFRTRLSLFLGEDADKDLATVKQHYGMTSNAAAIRRALSEHAKQITAPPAREVVPITAPPAREIMPIRYSKRRVH